MHGPSYRLQPSFPIPSFFTIPAGVEWRMRDERLMKLLHSHCMSLMRSSLPFILASYPVSLFLLVRNKFLLVRKTSLSAFIQRKFIMCPRKLGWNLE